MPKKVTAAEVAALAATLNGVARGDEPAGPALITAVRVLCRTLGERHPGGTLELRVPPFAAVQLGIGQRGGAVLQQHRRFVAIDEFNRL